MRSQDFILSKGRKWCEKGVNLMIFGPRVDLNLCIEDENSNFFFLFLWRHHWRNLLKEGKLLHAYFSKYDLLCKYIFKGLWIVGYINTGQLDLVVQNRAERQQGLNSFSAIFLPSRIDLRNALKPFKFCCLIEQKYLFPFYYFNLEFISNTVQIWYNDTLK